MAVGSWRTPSAWRQRIPQQRPRHDHQYPVNPTGFFDQQRGDKNPGVLETSAPALDAGWGFIGSDHLCIAHLAGVNMRANDQAGALWRVGLHDFRSGSDLGLPLPRNRLEGTRGGGPSLACIALVVDDLAGVEDDRATIGTAPSVQRAPPRRRKPFGLQGHQWRLDGFPFTRLRCGDARRSALHGGR